MTLEVESIDDTDVVVVAEDTADSLLGVGCVIAVESGDSSGL